jgi:hypothetical protein
MEAAMETKNSPQSQIAEKVAACLKELGLEAEVRVSEHEAVVHARKDYQGTCLRVVTHVSDRVIRTMSSGYAPPEIARARLVGAAIRPSLAAQAASSPSTGRDPDKDPCR